MATPRFEWSEHGASFPFLGHKSCSLRSGKSIRFKAVLEAFNCWGRSSIIHLNQHQVTTTALNERAYCRSIIFPLIKSPSQCPGTMRSFDFRGAHMNADHIGDLVTTINTTCTWLASAFAWRKQMISLYANPQAARRWHYKWSLAHVTVFVVGCIHVCVNDLQFARWEKTYPEAFR